jgi:hypothetical protein
MSASNRSAGDVRAEVHKRLTLNWLIQGASQHVGLTLHHLIGEELAAIDRRLPRLYDQFTLMGLLQYWRLEAALIFAWPPRFWRRAGSDPSHPFFGHRLLSTYGGELAEAGRQRALQRAKQKGVTRLPMMFALQLQAVLLRIRWCERRHLRELERLARHAAALVWGIPVDRLDGTISPALALPPMSPIKPRSVRDVFFLAGAVGWGCVRRDGDALRVRAIAVNGCLLAKELVKGTAELICLHGLGGLDDRTYADVMTAADQLGFEPAMIHSGGELWRRLLIAIPSDRKPADVLMHLARLEPQSLEHLMDAVISQPGWARELIESLGHGDECEGSSPTDR